METGKVVLNLEEGVKVLEIREGVAADPIVPQKMLIKNVSIEAIMQLKQSGVIMPGQNSYVKVNLEAGRLNYFENAEHPLGKEVQTSFEISPEYKNLSINSERFLRSEELIKWLRQNYMYIKFKSPERGMETVKEWIKNIQNVKFKFSTEIERTKDTKGNSSDSVRRFLDLGKELLPEEIHISCPFTAEHEIEFVVEIEMSAKEEHLYFQLFSLELIGLEKQRRAKIIEEQVQKLQENGFAIVYEH